MLKFAALFAFFGVLNAQYFTANNNAANRQEERYDPIPFENFYEFDTPDGGRTERQEKGDGAGNVQGYYLIIHPDGRERRVDYINDANGYRMSVRTNEIGTESLSPADVAFESSAPTAKELSLAHTAELERTGGVTTRKVVVDDGQGNVRVAVGRRINRRR